MVNCIFKKCFFLMVDLKDFIERKVDTSKMVADEMREALSNCSDFKNEKCMIEQLLRTNGHNAVFLLKFHPELNPIESVCERN